MIFYIDREYNFLRNWRFDDTDTLAEREISKRARKKPNDNGLFYCFLSANLTKRIGYKTKRKERPLIFNKKFSLYLVLYFFFGEQESSN